MNVFYGKKNTIRGLTSALAFARLLDKNILFNNISKNG